MEMVGARGRSGRRRRYARWNMSAWLCPAAPPAGVQDGRCHEMRAGDLFYIGPGHDSWVVGDEPYVSLHFLGAERYAQTHR